MSGPLLTLRLRQELDVVLARQRARRIAGLLGFLEHDQVRIATAVSEIARNAVAYADGGRVEFSLEGATAPQVFVIRVLDEGPGISGLADILCGRYRSTTGMGVGILGARRLMDGCSIGSNASRGTTVTLKKLIPADRPPISSGKTPSSCRIPTTSFPRVRWSSCPSFSSGNTRWSSTS